MLAGSLQSSGAAPQRGGATEGPLRPSFRLHKKAHSAGAKRAILFNPGKDWGQSRAPAFAVS